MNFHDSHGVGFNTASHGVDASGSSRCIEVNGEAMVNFGSCSYLGLDAHPDLIEGACSAARRHGTVFPVSRAYLTTELYERLESLLGAIYERPVLVAPSTTLGHIAALPTLVGDNDAVVLDAQVHTSVQTAAQLLRARGVPLKTIRHNDMTFLAKMIQRLEDKHDKVWYLADGVYSMYGDEAPFRELEELLDEHEGFHLYVDDAHGTGWAGEHGSGVARQRMEHHERMVLAVSLGKAFGAMGGALVFHDERQKQLVRKLGGPMIFSSPIQPPMLGAACASAELHLRPEHAIRRGRLRDLIGRCNDRLDRRGLPQFERNASPIFFVPVGPVGMTVEIVKRVMADGYYLNTAAYPAVPLNKSGLRFMMTLHLAPGDVDDLIESVGRHYQDVLIEHGMDEMDVAENFDIPPFQL